MRKQFPNDNRTDLRRIGGVLVVLAAVAIIFTACSKSNAHRAKATEVIAIDRSRSTEATGTWPQEVAGIVKEQTLRAFDDHVDTLVLVSIGSDLADTAKVAQVELNKLDCNNANTCDDDRNSLAGQAATAAGQVAATPVSKAGTDVIASINTAKAICGTNRCALTIVSDGADSRLAARGTAKQLVAKYGSEFPNLTGVTVRLIGLGADRADAAHVQRSREFWTLALKRAGATDIIIARSI